MGSFIKFILVGTLLATSLAARAGLQEGRMAYKNQDYQAALKEFVPLAEGGDPVALYYVALMYENSEGLPQDFAQAMKLYKWASEKNFAPAENNLGYMYETEAGSDRSYKDAAFWYRKAINDGSVEARFNLGMMYFIGRGSEVPRDGKKAAELFAQSAESGFTIAQVVLGRQYEYAVGVKPNLEQAYKWYIIAAKLGSAAGIAAKKEIEQKLDPAIRAAGEAGAREWLIRH